MFVDCLVFYNHMSVYWVELEILILNMLCKVNWIFRRRRKKENNDVEKLNRQNFSGHGCGASRLMVIIKLLIK